MKRILVALRSFPGLFCLLGILGSSPCLAQEPYPSRPIHIVVQFGPGTSTDILARLVGQKLSDALGQPVVINNKPGGSGQLGTDFAARAKADGYTLVMAVSSVFGIHPSLYAKLPFDVLRDFAPITNLALVEQTLVVPQGGFSSLRAAVAAAKTSPGGLPYASLGVGSTSHLTMEMFAAAAGLRLIHVPYKSSPEAAANLIGGSVPMMFDSMPAVLSQIKSGRLKAVAVSSLKRSSFLPDVPTLAEAGFAGIDALGWIGIAAPAGVPPPILDRLNGEIVAILAQPDVKARLEQMAYVPVGDSREEFGRFIRAEIAKWGRTVRESGAKVE